MDEMNPAYENFLNNMTRMGRTPRETTRKVSASKFLGRDDLAKQVELNSRKITILKKLELPGGSTYSSFEINGAGKDNTGKQSIAVCVGHRIDKDNKLNELLTEIKEKLHPMDVVRTIVSYKGELTTLRKKSLDNEDKTELSARITAIVCYIIASYHQEACDELDKQYLVASSLLPNGTSKEKLEALDDMLILYAEHGFNASTFATRVTASTRADLTLSLIHI